MIIVGAGLAGLIAGNLIPGSTVIEASSAPPEHRAVLRFRSKAVGDALGIPFKEVTVRKGIFFNGQFVEPSIQVANLYSKKVTSGNVLDRSIWNVEPAQRFIAPENFSALLAERVPIQLNRKFNFSVHAESPKDNLLPIISTAPMAVLERAIVGGDEPKFKSLGIYVKRYRVRDANVHQTIYFPSPDLMLYRATITGDLLSMEFTFEPTGESEFVELHEALVAFGLHEANIELVDAGVQKNGKIIPIDDRWRRMFIRQMTKDFKIYSLGRFATWRPGLLLDDVLNDIAVIKKLLASDSYEAALVGAK